MMNPRYNATGENNIDELLPDGDCTSLTGNKFQVIRTVSTNRESNGLTTTGHVSTSFVRWGIIYGVHHKGLCRDRHSLWSRVT